MVFLIKNVKP